MININAKDPLGTRGKIKTHYYRLELPCLSIQCSLHNHSNNVTQSEAKRPITSASISDCLKQCACSPDRELTGQRTKIAGNDAGESD